MSDLEIYLIVGILGGLLIVVVSMWLYSRSRRLRSPRGDSIPTISFAEKIEELVRSELALRPETASYQVDFSTATDGSLQIIIDGKPYLEIKDIADEPVRSAITRAFSAYQDLEEDQ